MKLKLQNNITNKKIIVQSHNPAYFYSPRKHGKRHAQENSIESTAEANTLKETAEERSLFGTHFNFNLNCTS